ncbi:YetF domain-containing protein [Rossellomorea aquimaris]|uniref:YetF domain-containing protein n=1 Tax=Rossellomorea aquimaris TaxID=189382 RepID=UPI0006961629|nr:YetF domain-containing protein [Rossellomorea aquimaris]
MEWKSILFEAEDLNYLELFLRTTILYFVLFLADKSLGFRQPGIVTPYNFLVGAGISHIAASRMVQPASQPIDAIAIIFVYILIILLISYSYIKLSPNIASKRQIVLVKKGKVDKGNLRKSMLTLDNLLSIVRKKNVFDLQNVDYVISEPNGDFSVAKNSHSLPVTKSTMNIPMTTKELTKILIYDGKVDRKIMKEKHLNIDWVYLQLKEQNVTDIEDVNLGLITEQNELFIH